MVKIQWAGDRQSNKFASAVDVQMEFLFVFNATDFQMKWEKYKVQNI